MFSKLLGNSANKEILRQMLRKNRVPHSLLFAGAEGIGKRCFALELAKSFVCLNPQQQEACDNCVACRRAEIFAFPGAEAKKEDFQRVFFSEHIDIGTIIPYRKNILVEAVRELEREANFRPYEARARCFIIDDADKMNDAASNALLKTLEEPAPTSYIFLISSRPDALLQTIRSRCQTLRFAPIPKVEIEKYLISTQKFSPAEAALIAKASDGSLQMAVSFDLEKFRGQRNLMLKVLQSIGNKTDYLSLLKIGEEMNEAKNKGDYEFSLKILQTLIRDLWIIKLGGSEENLVNADLQIPLRNLSEIHKTSSLAKWISEIETLQANLEVNLNKKISTDALFMQMATD
jgi:DNA polymerase-3 subunit delta'